MSCVILIYQLILFACTANGNSIFQNESVFEIQSQYVTISNNVKLTILEVLDKKIFTLLSDPFGKTNRTVTDRDGEMLLNNVKLFQRCLSDVKKMWRNRKLDQNESLKRSARLLFNKGGPQFLLVVLSNQTDIFMDAFKLEPHEMYEFFHYRTKSNKDWDILNSILSLQK
uniref:Uncharacterized protein n=1 Tax=Clastoptera arizonana TaxID=38151 RepID=A0A1B6DHA5_9HEMI